MTSVQTIKQKFRALKHFSLRCREFTPSCHSDRSPTDVGGRTEWRKPEDVCSTMLLQGVLTEPLKRTHDAFDPECRTNHAQTFVSGHDFSRAEKLHTNQGFSPCCCFLRSTPTLKLLWRASPST